MNFDLIGVEFALKNDGQENHGGSAENIDALLRQAKLVNRCLPRLNFALEEAILAASNTLLGCDIIFANITLA